MSEENLEGVRRGFEAFNSGDVEAVMEGVDPDVEWHVPPMLPEKTVYYGHAGVRELFQNLVDAFSDFEVMVEEMFDVNDKVVVMAAVRGRGHESGADVTTPSFGWVWTFRDDKVVLVEVYPNRAETLEALGLDR